MPVTATQSEIASAFSLLRSVALSAANSSNEDAELSAVREVAEKARKVYIAECAAAPTITASGANAAALFTAASIADGDVFVVSNSADTTDDALETAKGSAPAAGNVFQRVGSAIEYVGASRTDVAGLDALVNL